MWGSVYKNAWEPLIITHKILIKLMVRNYYLDNEKTETLFKKLKILHIYINSLINCR